jgi:quercetin dioxygenase-like cupin family protein
VTPVTSVSVTSSGQPIVLPQRDARMTVSVYDIPPGAVLPEHKHPIPRYGYGLSGRQRVSIAETDKIQEFRTGDFIAEAVNQWHSATNAGTTPIKLLVIDITEGDQKNVIVKH